MKTLLLDSSNTDLNIAICIDNEMKYVVSYPCWQRQSELMIPELEKGLKESMEKGVLAGYPMVGVKATLFDGSYHPVDSSEMSFKMAATLAFKNGISQASPMLLEPIVTLNAICNDEAMGDIIGDINKRRGRVLGMSPTADGMQEIIAEVPEAEMNTFSTSMRQITQGRGSFTTAFARYERCPEHIAQKVIEAAEKE